MAIDLSPGNVIQWTKEGRVFHGFTGTLDTPEALTATALVRQSPTFYIRVPAGVVIIPITSLMVPEATGAAVCQLLVSTCDNDIGTGNHTALTPVNVNTRYAGVRSKVLAYGTEAGNTGTAPTNVADLWRQYGQADFDAITGAPTPPFIYAPFAGEGAFAAIGSSSNVNCYMVYCSVGTSSTWFTLHTWAEFTYDEFYAA